MLFSWWRRRDADLEDELAAHLRMAVANRIAHGMDPRTAEREARREFGNITVARELTRDQWRWQLLEQLAQDGRYAVRALARSPAFMIAVVASLALGIAGNVAVFSVVNGALLRPLGVREPNRLVVLSAGTRWNVEGFLYEQFRDRAQFLTGLTAAADVTLPNVSVAGAAATTQASVTIAAGNYFEVLGARMARGRAFLDGDDRPEAEPAAVVSAAFADRMLGTLSPVGAQLTIGRRTFPVVGVADRRFTGDHAGHSTDIWVPRSFEDAVMDGSTRLHGGFRMLGQLELGATIAAAQARNASIWRQILLSASGPSPRASALAEIDAMALRVESGRAGFSLERKVLRGPLVMVQLLAAVLLLIASLNVGTLVLARSFARQRELATRASLGASARRLRRQLFTEAVLLVGIGGVLGIAMGFAGAEWLMRLLAAGVSPVSVDISPDWRVGAAIAAACALAVMIIGGVPSLMAARLSLFHGLRTTSGTSSGRRVPGLAPGKLLVASQVALSTTLLFSSALFATSLWELRHRDLGYERSDAIVLVRTNPSAAGRQRGEPVADLWERVERELATLPGVASAALSTRGLLGSDPMGSPIKVIGSTPPPNAEEFVPWNVVSPGFFRTIGMSLLAGRDFGPGDAADAPRVAVINEAVARRYFGSASPIGRRFTIAPYAEPTEVVGVVRDAIYDDPRESGRSMVYLPYAQSTRKLWALVVVIRLPDASARQIANVREALARADPRVPIVGVTSTWTQGERSMVRERLLATLSLAGGGVALLLATMGLYGLSGYTVSRRTYEIGVRMALGATRRDIARIVMMETLGLVAGGLAVGLPAAWGASRVVSGLLFGVAPDDVGVYIAPMLAVSVAGLVAAWPPSVRATRVSPRVAMTAQ